MIRPVACRRTNTRRETWLEAGDLVPANSLLFLFRLAQEERTKEEGEAAYR